MKNPFVFVSLPLEFGSSPSDIQQKCSRLRIQSTTPAFANEWAHIPFPARDDICEICRFKCYFQIEHRTRSKPYMFTKFMSKWMNIIQPMLTKIAINMARIVSFLNRWIRKTRTGAIRNICMSMERYQDWERHFFGDDRNTIYWMRSRNISRLLSASLTVPLLFA